MNSFGCNSVVINESRLLEEKLASLNIFIYESPEYLRLDPDEQDRLMRQAEIMGQYAAILEERIGAFSL